MTVFIVFVLVLGAKWYDDFLIWYAGCSVASRWPIMTLAVLMIAFWQAVAVFVLCLVSKNRGYALLIGLAGAAVVLITGGNRYDGLDVLFVVVATLAAIWKLTPYEEGETRGEVLAFAGQAAGVVVLLIACGAAGLWYYANHGSQSAAPLVAGQAPAPLEVWQPPPRGFGSDSITVVSEETRLEKLARANAEAAALLRGTAFERSAASDDAPARGARRGAPNDKRHCLDLRDNAAVARCVGE